MTRRLKKELIWAVILLGISVLLAGLPVGFDYARALDVQMHDEYYVFEPLQNILDYWLYLIILRYALIGLNQLIDSNAEAAIILSIVNLVLLLKALIVLFQVWSPFQDEGLAYGGSASDFAFWWTLRKMLYTGLLLIMVALQVILIRKVVQHRRIAQGIIE